jgi:hypothetical protein
MSFRPLEDPESDGNICILFFFVNIESLECFQKCSILLQCRIVQFLHERFEERLLQPIIKP